MAPSFVRSSNVGCGGRSPARSRAAQGLGLAACERCCRPASARKKGRPGGHRSTLTSAASRPARIRKATMGRHEARHSARPAARVLSVHVCRVWSFRAVRPPSSAHHTPASASSRSFLHGTAITCRRNPPAGPSPGSGFTTRTWCAASQGRCSSRARRARGAWQRAGQALIAAGARGVPQGLSRPLRGGGELLAFTHAYERLIQGEPRPEGERLLRELKERVLASPRTRLDVSTLASEHGSSRTAFSHYFRERTGVCAGSFHDRGAAASGRALARAQRAFRSRGSPRDCGFANANHFGKVFRRFRQQTAGAYRRALR